MNVFHDDDNTDLQELVFHDGTCIQIYTSKLDGKVVVQVDTADTEPEDAEGDHVRVYYNDAVATKWES